MVIPQNELDYEVNNLGISSLTHRKAKVRLEVFPPKSGASGQVFLQQLDSIGNTKKSQSFSGVLGFWEATRKFEEIISKALNLEEVVGFEVGMVIDILKDTAKLKKGDKVLVLEVNSDGKASRFRKLTPQELQNFENSPYVTRLAKSDDLAFLIQAKLTSLNDVEPNVEYDFDFGGEEYYELPRRFDYRNYKPSENYQDPSDGETYVIRSIAFKKEGNGYAIGLMVIDKDGVKGWRKLY
jgi:hypothetical protein